MALDIKDGLGAAATLKTTLDGADHVPHHIVDSSALPSGAATAANQTAIIGYVDGIEGLLTTIDADTGSILTAAQLLDDVVLAEDAAHSSGDKGVMLLVVRHDAGGTLAGTTGDYAPLQVDSNGNLRVTGGGGGTEYTEDAAAASDPVGGASILVRADTPATITSANGDNVAQRGTNYGAAFCQLVTSSGAFIDSVGGGTQYAVDAALGSTPTGTLAVAIRDDALSTLTPVEGDAIGLRVDANGALWTTVSGTVTVGTHAVTQSGTWTVTGAGGTFPVTDSGGSITVDAPVGTPVFVRLSDGTSAIATLPVSLSSVPSHAVTNAGTFAVQVDGAGLTSLQLLDDVVFADDAAFTLTSSKVAMVGAIRDNILGTLSAAEGDAVPLRVDTNGALWVVGQDIATETTADGIKTATEAMHGTLITWNAAAVAPKLAKLSSASTGNQALVSAVVGKKIRILALHVMATASTNAVYINDGTADLYADSTRKIPLDITGATGPGGFSLPYNPAGWFETAATNRPININLGSANGVVAVATYVEV